MRKNFVRSAAVLSSVGLALAVAGCGNTSGNQSSSSNKTNTAASAKPIVMVPAPNGNFQKNFNPFQGNADPGTAGLVYQPLFYFNTISSNRYGFLGKSYSWSNNNKTLTVNLRQNATWTDGTPFTSQDVVFTFDLLKKYPSADTSAVWGKLSSVKANGKYQVIFNFKQPDVPFAVYVLSTYIVPKHIWSSLGDPTKVNMTNPVGTGPYILDKFTPQLYTFKANDKYYLGKPPVPKVEFPAYSSNNSADLALAKGQVNWGGNFIPNIKKVYTSKSSHNKYWFPPENIVTVYPNLKDPLLSQLPVRQAISLAINRSEISKKGEYGYESVASPTGLTLPAFKSWLDPNLTPAETKFSYNPQKAEQILQKAGFKKGSDGIYVSPSGKKLSFTLQVVSGWSDWDTDCSLIAKQLKKAGIEVKVQQEQYGAYYSNLTKHKFQLAMSWTNAGPGPYYQYQNLLQTGVQWNLEQWSNTKTDQALNNFSSTTNKTQQRKDIYTLEKTMADQLPAIPIVYGAVWFEYNDSNYTGWPTASNPYAKPAPFAWPAPAIVLMHLKPVN